MSRRLLALAALALPTPALAQTSFLDLNTSGNTFGTTAGTGAGAVFVRGFLGGTGVTVRIQSNAATNPLSINDTTVTNSWTRSTVNNTSPQYNHAVYSPATGGIDRVGFTKPASAAATSATVSITFDAPIAANTLRFHVAHLDQTRFDFTPTANLTSLSVRSGTGGPGAGGAGVDGLGLGGTGASLNKILLDQNAGTRNEGTSRDENGIPPSATSQVVRSAYGTVDLNSTADLSSITFTATTFDTTAGNDGGSFTLSVTPVPEPGLGLAAAAAGLAGWRRWRRA